MWSDRFSNFNPRTPYGMRLITFLHYCIFNACISIHAPLTGCDIKTLADYFNVSLISIHAPLTGCDQAGEEGWKVCQDFNPRTPYGMRQEFGELDVLIIEFQSTHPLRDATAKKAKSLLEFHSF